MWLRTTTDPLGKLLLEKYGMHMLSRPRENVSVFDVFGVRDGKTFQSGRLDTFLRSNFDKPEVAEGERLLDIDTTVSDAVSGNVGLNFLQGFLAFFGVGMLAGVSTALEKSKSHSLRFSFGGCTRNHVKDGFELDWKLSEHPFVRENSAMKEDYSYYIATGVHYCNQLKFEALDQNMTKVNLAADVIALGGGNTGLSVNKDRQVTATIDKTLAYGVELNEIIYDEKRARLQLAEAKNYMQLMAAGVDWPKARVGGPDDLMTIHLDN